MDVGALNRMIAEDAALRRRQRLQPVGGKGDKIFPPTYPGEGRNAPPRHVYERRRLNGAEVWCVLVDSVQSQANRLEECLLDAIRGGVPVPYVEVDFTEAELTASARSRRSTRRTASMTPFCATASTGARPSWRAISASVLPKPRRRMLRRCSKYRRRRCCSARGTRPGEGGGLGAKFARCLISEIVGIDVPVEDVVVNQRTGEVETRTSGRRTGSRIDPLGVLRKVKVFKGENGWSTTKAGAGKNAKEVRPSEINHGNIAPSVQPLGVTCDHLEHSFVLSFAALRRLRFGGAEKERSGSQPACRARARRAHRTRHAGLRAPIALRSRLRGAHAARTGALRWLDRSNRDRPQASTRALRSGIRCCAKAGFALSSKPLELKPQDKLVEIVRESQKLALALEGGDEEGTSQNESNS